MEAIDDVMGRARRRCRLTLVAGLRDLRPRSAG